MSEQGRCVCTWIGGKKALVLGVDSKRLLHWCSQGMKSVCRWTSQYREESHWRLYGVLLSPLLPYLPYLRWLPCVQARGRLNERLGTLLAALMLLRSRRHCLRHRMSV